MSAVTHNHTHDHAHGLHNPQEPTWQEQLKMNRLGMWVFCLSESFLFIALLAARFYLWRDPEVGLTRPGLEQFPALMATIVLLVSSFFMNRAEVAISKGDMKNFNLGMAMTALLGTIFLLTVVFVEWGVGSADPHITVSDGAFGAMFFGMTGMHAFHVLTGIILILIVWGNGRRGVYTAEQHWGVEACAIYWHYVDLVWVFFYPAIYLIGHAIHYTH